MLYTYRSCSKAIPQVKTSDDPNKDEIYRRTFEILDPEINKLKNFCAFQNRTVSMFKEIVSKCINERKRVLSEQFMLHMIKILDLFAILDELKNMKASLNNDFRCLAMPS